MGLVALDHGQSVLFWVQVSEFYINYFVRGTLYKGDLLERPKNSKYSKGHKCGEKKLFYIDCEEEEEQEQEPSQDENVEEISSEELTPTISCNELVGISTPQTLKIEGYIKKKNVIFLIDSGSTHNFIHYRLAKALNCFVYLAP